MNLYGHKVNQLGRYFNKKLNEKISSLGLYSSQWGIILYLYKKKKCTQVELSNYLHVEAPTITRTINRMEKMGWVIREDGDDKREKYIRLTEKAYDIYPRWDEASREIETACTENITKGELNIFNSVLERMIRNLE
ncbi:transcriptional regulator, MarR family [Gottschalkia acidurici 9a]|uniref:Transcriptional regulator, MarR family n=1 Tax=Gottschalkia acidurici (strain ATCC 7906 / DSM 604 / BCRC 14475 / CIP 104303 / KCTC 5404 / NCIMB 10678 / 9a) TaxID=1128398 RepID=K0B2L1_GOTA9|nr:MarR family transcriptional regulator [Gottschalkia acidurici]AFS79734.1 transcriptional regulator, MarR family [Gottschalkia acidurici 9a]